MVIQLNRRDVGYTIVSRFEESFRSFLSLALSIFFSNYEEGIPSGVMDKARKRSSKLAWDTADDFGSPVYLVISFSNQTSKQITSLGDCQNW